MQARRDEILAKKAKLAELRRQKELRQEGLAQRWSTPDVRALKCYDILRIDLVKHSQQLLHQRALRTARKTLIFSYQVFWGRAVVHTIPLGTRSRGQRPLQVQQSFQPLLRTAALETQNRYSTKLSQPQRKPLQPLTNMASTKPA